MSPHFRRFFQVYLNLALAVLCAFAFNSRYLRWQDCFNEHGRCYDPETQTVFTTGGLIWGIFAVLFAGFALRALWRERKSP